MHFSNFYVNNFFKIRFIEDNDGKWPVFKLIQLVTLFLLRRGWLVSTRQIISHLYISRENLLIRVFLSKLLYFLLKMRYSFVILYILIINAGKLAYLRFFSLNALVLPIHFQPIHTKGKRHVVSMKMRRLIFKFLLDE